MGRRYHQSTRRAPPRHTDQIAMIAASHQSRCVSAGSVIAVIAADVDPLQSIGRPGPAPAAVVGGVERRERQRTQSDGSGDGSDDGRRARGKRPSKSRARIQRAQSAHLRNGRRRSACRRPCRRNAFLRRACHPPPPCMPPMPPPWPPAAAMPPPLPPPPPPRANAGDASASAVASAPAMRQLRSLLFIPIPPWLNRSDGYRRKKKTISRAK